MALWVQRAAVGAAVACAVSGLTVRPSGPTTDVLSAVAMGDKCCGGHQPCNGHIPDIPARMFRDNEGTVRTVVGSVSYYPMSGPSILNQSRSCTCAYNKTADPNPADFAANEYLDSTIAFENGTVVSLVHTEFPGGQYGMCTGQGYPECWTVSVGLVVSHDWGATWKHARPPPQHLVAAVPYRYNETQLASGWGDPSNILQHPTDGYYYAAVWNRHQVGLQPPGICIMRTNNLLDPASWRAFDGSGYTVRFASAYTEDPGTAKDHVCTVTNLPAGSVYDGCAAHGLFWSEYLELFVVTLGCDQAKTAVFKYATSADLVQWSEAKVLLSGAEARNMTSYVRLGMNYPTFIDPASTDRNFGTIGQHPDLFWVSIGDNPHDIGRHLLATPFTFQK